MTVHHFYNRYHIGDQLFNLKFFFNIASILKQESIHINYYFKTGLPVCEFEKYTDPATVTLIPVDNFSTLPASAVELWMGNSRNGVRHWHFDRYYNEHYTYIVSILGLNLDKYKINCSMYQPEPYLLDIYNTLDDKYKGLDILILNSVPQSAQFHYDKSEFDNLCSFLSSKFNVAVSTYVSDDIKCTQSDGLSIQDIGAISTHCKYIVAVLSGPCTSCYNSYTKDNVKKWFILHNHVCHYEIDHVNTINLNDVRSFFNTLDI